MNSRQRGATWILVALLAGRLLDRFDLPFERRMSPAPALPVPAGSPAPAEIDSTPPSTVTTDHAPQSGTSRATATASPATAPLPINRASVTDLQRLPGVGPVLAARIVAHRDAHGPFHGVEDLRAVRGLGPKTCARLAPLVRFD